MRCLVRRRLSDTADHLSWFPTSGRVEATRTPADSHTNDFMPGRSKSRADRDLKRALKIVDREYGTPDGERRPHIRGIARFGELFLFTEDEDKQLNAMRELIDRYVAQPRPPRPLSLAVFGPPGSGKSFAVGQILKQVEKTSTVEL